MLAAALSLSILRRRLHVCEYNHLYLARRRLELCREAAHLQLHCPRRGVACIAPPCAITPSAQCRSRHAGHFVHLGSATKTGKYAVTKGVIVVQAFDHDFFILLQQAKVTVNAASTEAHSEHR